MTSPYVTFLRFMPRASRRTRRIFVAAALLGYPLLLLGYGTLVAPGRLSSAAWAPVAIALFSTTLVGVVGIYGYARGRAALNTLLDERERQIRDRAWVNAYRILVGMIWLAVIVLFILSFDGPVAIGGSELAWIVIPVATLYLPLLPSATLAWTEPDPPADVDDATAVR